MLCAYSLVGCAFSRKQSRGTTRGNREVNCFTYRKFISKIAVIQSFSESEPSVLHATDIVGIIAVALFIVYLKQNTSRLCRRLKCDVNSSVLMEIATSFSPPLNLRIPSVISALTGSGRYLTFQAIPDLLPIPGFCLPLSRPRLRSGHKYRFLRFYSLLYQGCRSR